MNDETERLVRWRREQLERAGYPPDYALGLAQNPLVDLHLAVSLLEHGCDVETAQRILT
jgi:hypothetical protein